MDLVTLTCDHCGVHVEDGAGRYVDTYRVCADCYEQLCSEGGEVMSEQCNTCGGTGRWLTTTEDSPTELIDLGHCPDCDRVSFCIHCGSSLDEQGLCIACQPPSGDDYPVEGVVPPTYLNEMEATITWTS